MVNIATIEKSPPLPWMGEGWGEGDTPFSYHLIRCLRTGSVTMSTEKAKTLRQNSTEAERELWQHLRRFQMNGHKFRRQHPIGPYIVDFACIERNLAIEIDGGHHSKEAEYDDARTEWLESQGFKVLRFWNNQVLKEIEAVKLAIWDALEAERPPP